MYIIIKCIKLILKNLEGSIFLILIPKNDENIIDIPSDG